MLAATVSEYKQVFQHTRFAGKLTALGGALICTSYFTLNSGSDFPGWRALLPALGAALVLGFADVAPSMILTFLRSRVMVHIGKISYSLYLWHWPVILAVQGLGESPLAPPLDSELGHTMRSACTLVLFGLGELQVCGVPVALVEMDSSGQRWGWRGSSSWYGCGQAEQSD